MGWGQAGTAGNFFQILVPDRFFYVADMVMRSAVSTLPRINHLTVKIPHQDCMPKPAIKIIIKNSNTQANLKRLQQTIKTEMNKNKSLSFPRTQSE